MTAAQSLSNTYERSEKGKSSSACCVQAPIFEVVDVFDEAVIDAIVRCVSVKLSSVLVELCCCSSVWIDAVACRGVWLPIGAQPATVRDKECFDGDSRMLVDELVPQRWPSQGVSSNTEDQQIL